MEKEKKFYNMKIYKKPKENLKNKRCCCFYLIHRPKETFLESGTYVILQSHYYNDTNPCFLCKIKDDFREEIKFLASDKKEDIYIHFDVTKYDLEPQYDIIKIKQAKLFYGTVLDSHDVNYHVKYTTIPIDINKVTTYNDKVYVLPKGTKNKEAHIIFDMYKQGVIEW